MKIWVDADACPKVIKEILYRAAKRVQVEVVLVSNLYLRVPPSEFIKTVQVPEGFDVADEYIVENIQDGDLVITADIPLASNVVDKNAQALNPRGQLYTSDNIQEALSMRNLMDELRSTGINTGGPATFSMKDRENFANQLDKILVSKC